MTCRIVAEISANHRGSFNRACAIVDAAKAAGAHAVKLQTWTPDTMVLDPSLTIEEGPWAGRAMVELYREALLPWDTQRAVFRYAASYGIECFSSVFDTEALAFLQSLGCPRYKIASFELVDLPLIRAVAATGKPMILSTGMATKDEIQDAVAAARAGGAKDITLLKCTSAYPADGTAANLNTMLAMGKVWDTAYGLSDHTPGIGVAVTAAALGASMIEKHVTLRRADGGLDAAFSIEPEELAALVREAGHAAGAMGVGTVLGPQKSEKPQLELRRSLHFARAMEAGEEIHRQDLITARPAHGLPPRMIGKLIGERTIANVSKGDPVTWRNVERRPMAKVLEKSRL